MLKKVLSAGILVVATLTPVMIAGPVMAQDEPGAPQILPPSGPYSVGRTAYVWVDESREEVHTVEDTEDVRELLVEVWYPADPAEDAEYGVYMEKPMSDLFGLILGLEDDSYNAILSNAFPDAPVSEAEATYPVVILDPGFSMAPRQYQIIIEDLASHGYVVFSASHPYATTMTVYPDGRVIEPLSQADISQLWAPDNFYLAEFQHMWVPDVQFMLAQIEQINADDPQGLFTGRLDLSKFGMVGHSQGGRTISEVCLLDDRCAAVANLDGGYSVQVDLTFDKPFMFILAYDETEGLDTFFQVSDSALEAMESDFYTLMVPLTKHGFFADMAFVIPLVVENIDAESFAAGQYALWDYRLYIRSFMDKYIRDLDVPLLDGPSEDYPEVFFMRRREAITPPTAYGDLAEAQLPDNRGTIAVGEADVWTYEGQAGEELILWLMADKPAGRTTQEQRVQFGLLDTVLVLRAPDGSVLGANDDYGMSTDSALENIVLPVDGVYHIEVRSIENTTAGWYTLVIQSSLVESETESDASEGDG